MNKNLELHKPIVTEKIPDGKSVTITLESWQKRMFRDFLLSIKKERPIEALIINFSKGTHLNTYRVPNLKMREEIFELYFTDAQKVQLEKVTGLPTVDSIEISKQMLDSQTIVIR